MARIYFLSSYDEYLQHLHFIEQFAIQLSPEDMLLIVNCEDLGAFLLLDKNRLDKSSNVIDLGAYRYKESRPYLINVIFEKLHLQENRKILINNIDKAMGIEAVYYTNMLNGASLFYSISLEKFLTKRVRKIYVPTLRHLSFGKDSHFSPKIFSQWLKYLMMYGRYSSIINLGHKNIFGISVRYFTDFIYFFPPQKSDNTISRIPLKMLQKNDRNIIFVCQPLLKNDRVSRKNFQQFFNIIISKFNELNIKLVFKLHPGEDISFYQQFLCPILDRKIPFQLMDLSYVSIVMTFSSGAVRGSQLPVISCLDLIDFNIDDHHIQIKRNFLKLNEDNKNILVPRNWEEFEADVKKNINN